ncbi:MAG: HAD hydrolase-like protein [Candidatus Saccharimonadales bacterium]
MSYNTVLFDVDGTLCDPGKSMIECARYALSKFDIIETDNENLRRLMGPPLEHAFRDYYDFDEEQSTQAVVYFRDMMQREGIRLYEPYPGIPELLKELHDSGKTLAVVTSKIEHIAIETLTKTGLIEYFDTISAQQPNIVVHKEGILKKALNDLKITDLRSVIMIGDRRHDVEAANARSVDSVGVLWGYGTIDEFKNEGATYTVSNSKELSQLLLSK